MKYSAHKINIRSIRKMEVGETMLVKHGKRVEYKGGYTTAPKHYKENDEGVYMAHEIMQAIKEWTPFCDNECGKTAIIIIKRTSENRYNATIGDHFSTKNKDYEIVTTTLFDHEIKV